MFGRALWRRAVYYSGDWRQWSKALYITVVVRRKTNCDTSRKRSIAQLADMFRTIGLAALSLLLPLSLAQITNDFESGWDQTTWATYAPDCNQGGTVSLDTTKAHSGSNSMKVVGAGGYCGHAFFGTTKVPSGDVYVRTWL